MAPCVGPGRVAVHRQNGEPGVGGRAGIEQIPAAGHPSVIGSVDEKRPGSVPAVEVCSRQRARSLRLGVHHSISTTAALMPEPMPWNITPSPGSRVSCTLASVTGMAAGPMLPYSGKLRTTRSPSIPSVSITAWVCTDET